MRRLVTSLDHWVHDLKRAAVSIETAVDRLSYALFFAGIFLFALSFSDFGTKVFGEFLGYIGPSIATVAFLAKVYMSMRDQNPAIPLQRPVKNIDLASLIANGATLDLRFPADSAVQEVEDLIQRIFRYDRRPFFSRTTTERSKRIQSLQDRLRYHPRSIALYPSSAPISDVISISQVVPISKTELEYLLSGRLTIPELFELSVPKARGEVALVIAYGSTRQNLPSSHVLRHITSHIASLAADRLTTVAVAISEKSRRRWVKSFGFEFQGRTRNETEIWALELSP